MKFLYLRDADFPARFAALVNEARETTSKVDQPVADIIAAVRLNGDQALCEYTAKFDKFDLAPKAIAIDSAEIEAAVAKVEPVLIEALDLAAKRIERFHRAQMPRDLELDEPGLKLGMRWNALDSVGIYVPGGKAAYPSSVLMNAIPARVAGVSRIAMCVPTPGGMLNPLVLAAAQRAGVSEIYRVGGAQAIAALAYGTATIVPVDRIVGPGNAYVAEAKRQVFGRVGIDSIAGPSEVLVVADKNNDPRLVAVDLLAQAEHDESAQSILITDDEAFALAVASAVMVELQTLPRAAIAGASWESHGAIIVAENLEQVPALVDQLAPEHLELLVADPVALFALIKHAGAAFLGNFCPEAIGDYVGGPNHVLPTGRTARFASGLSVFDFIKRTTWIYGQREGLADIGPAAVILAEAEGLHAHGRSVALRLNKAR